MPPEFFGIDLRTTWGPGRSRSLAAASEIWSLGCSLFYLANGGRDPWWHYRGVANWPWYPSVLAVYADILEAPPREAIEKVTVQKAKQIIVMKSIL
eukprot:scaffold386091_cov53-Prasinocladus_malaysianus.AAC.1